MSADKTTKTIRPTNPADLGTESTPGADGTGEARKTASFKYRKAANFKFRKTASASGRFRKLGRLTRNFRV